MPIRAILFDKDGTLVDIQLTLGPATCDVLSRLSGGEPAMFVRLAELTRVDAGTRRLMPGCPVISEATDVYGRTWAQALGRPYSGDFEREIASSALSKGISVRAPCASATATVVEARSTSTTATTFPVISLAVASWAPNSTSMRT